MHFSIAMPLHLSRVIDKSDKRYTLSWKSIGELEIEKIIKETERIEKCDEPFVIFLQEQTYQLPFLNIDY